ncbi:MAG: DUF3105 domain-containing protein [Chloroflexi bacterium]|nr:DUF3105 domain-containing protein [Chloroflexota bacterium]
MIKKNKLWILPGLMLLVTGLGCVTVTRMFEPPLAPTPSPLPTLEAVPIEYAVPDEGKSHLQLGDTGIYEHYPPSSGSHYGQTFEWGYYDEEVPPEYYVHNLEHGGIVILYNCPEACSDTQDALFQLFNHAPADTTFNKVKIIVSPNSQITSPVIALAWGWELDLETVDADLLLDFYDRHVNQGPELVP